MEDSDRIYVQEQAHSKIYRDRIKKWFRYHNRVQHPARVDHSEFIGILGFVEDKCGHNLFDGNPAKQDWNTLLKTVNKMGYEELKHINHRIEQFKSEKLAQGNKNR